MSFLVYRSSAGSGKTFTLVKEYLKIALGTDDSMVFSRILAITFTNKAANEMTDRILETLEEMSGVVTPMKGRSKDMMRILGEELSVPELIIKNRSRKTLKKIVHNYRDFSVGTIDSFVHKVIRSFAQEMGLNQTFEVELNTESVLKRAVDMMLDRVGVDKVLTKFIEDYIDSKFENGNTWKIDEDLYRFAYGLLRTHDWYYLEKAKSLDLNTYAEKYTALRKSVSVYENDLSEIAKKAVSVALDGVELSSYAYGGHFIKHFQKIIAGEFRVEVGKRTLGLLKESSNWVSGTGKEDKDLIEEKRSQILTYFHQIERIREESEAKYILENLLFTNLYRVALLSEMDKEIQKIKAENDLVLISDFNELVSQVTRSEPVPFIYEKLGEKYSHFLFDEFQDTSLMQWHNMLPLVENSLANGGNSMVVGDAKQSIYRWRGGVVEQFGMLPRVFNPYKDLFAEEREISLRENYLETKPLQVNYRSKANIVEFNNLFFSEAANVFDKQVDRFYDDVVQKEKDVLSAGLVEFRFFYKNKEEATQDVFSAIADLIFEVREDGYDLKNIAILTRTKSETPHLVEYLDAHGIDVISSESLLVNNSAYVKLIVATLHHLNQPNEPYYMSEILLRLNELEPKINFHSVMAGAKKMNQKIFVSILLSWGIDFNRNSLLALPIYEMVTGVLDVFKANNVKDNRLAAWVDYVYQKSLKIGFGIFDLLDDWRLQQDKLSIQIPEDVDAVNIMTIHAAKGLDWPVVILAQGNWTPKHKEHNFWVELPEANPIPVAILPHSDSKINGSPFKQEYEVENDAVILDNLNALYVAFTRPADRLYVFGIKPKERFFKDLLPVLIDINSPKVKTGYADIEKVKKNGDVTSSKELVMFRYGLPDMMDGEKKNDYSNLIKIPNRRSSSYQRKLKVKKNYIKRMNDSGQRDFGNLVHKAFSFIETIDDVDAVINDLLRKGEVSLEEKDTLKLLIEKVIIHKEAAPFFTKNLEVRNESEIILPNGDLMRPDRVVIHDNQATVIDFKTGMKSPEHEQQVVSYKNHLEKMGYENVKAVLIYTGEVDVIEV